MYKRLLTTSALILGMAAAAPPMAEAQILACGIRADVIERLGDKYGETRRGGGLAGPSAIIELYASEKTGSWTLLRTDTRGLSCVMAAGEGWQSEAGMVTPAGDPT